MWGWDLGHDVGLGATDVGLGSVGRCGADPQMWGWDLWGDVGHRCGVGPIDVRPIEVGLGPIDVGWTPRCGVGPTDVGLGCGGDVGHRCGAGIWEGMWGGTCRCGAGICGEMWGTDVGWDP